MAKVNDVTTSAHQDDNFQVCMPFTLAQESPDPDDWDSPKNFSDDPHDPGGATMDGIIQSEYDNWRQAHGFPIKSVEGISEMAGYAIYRSSYWLPLCPTLPPGLDLCLFDSNVNEGPREGIKILQVAVGVTNDGIFGPNTRAAVDAVKSVPDAVVAFTKRRVAVYHETANFKYFGTDWIRRANEIGAQAYVMAGGDSNNWKNFT